MNIWKKTNDSVIQYRQQAAAQTGTIHVQYSLNMYCGGSRKYLFLSMNNLLIYFLSI